jgi:glycosyltransferase involved in cell wall biosynthesis
MKKVPLEIVVPIYNEGKNILRLLELFEEFVKTDFRILLCYDLDEDNVFSFKNKFDKFKLDIVFVKNPSTGPCAAIKEGLYFGNSDCVIVYPADDFLNINIIDKMYLSFKENNEVVVASRFMKGGSMKGCPIVKSILVRLASTTLYKLSSIPVRDASNGFRLFSRKLLNTIKIETKIGFAYSLELLSKCNRLKFKMHEIPAQWEERSEGSSRFKIIKWLPEYLRWYLYGMSTTWLKRGPEHVKKKI